jgi:hypothetical protein
MFGPLKLGHALAPVAMLGVLGAPAVAGTHPGAPPRIAAPCSPDGNCIPNYRSYGFYPTYWRPFPTDTSGIVPTPEEGAEQTEEQNLGGPQLPTPGEEGQAGPRPRMPGVPGAVAPQGEAPPAGEAPLDAIPAPMIEPGPGPAAPLPGAGEGEAVPDPLDPFGGTPPAPPAWMQEPIENASFLSQPGVGLPAQPAVMTGPNLDGDDAPPALPPGLHGALNLVAPPHVWSNQAMATTLNQPRSVGSISRPASDPGVVQASAQTPLGIQLINPASAVSVEPGVEGLQQAIYFEASDQPAELPPVAPAN